MTLTAALWHLRSRPALLRQEPEQAESRADLAARLTRASGGVVFTTIQKFEEPTAR
jgi:type I site-specific restriction-modification system R (restriction) subunit